MNKLPHGKLLTAQGYADAYSEDQGFERVCIMARQLRNIEFLLKEQPLSILEVGCGPDLLCRYRGLSGLSFRRWAIVEPAASYAASAASATCGDSRFLVIEDYVENRQAMLLELEPDGYQCVVVSGLVHETTEPLELLRALSPVMKPGGAILVSAPNAQSFHRLLALANGIISDIHELSALDHKLGHPQVFDPTSLAELVASAGFTELQFDGYLFKPFTNAQMHVLTRGPGEALVPGLIALGQQFPNQAAEICITARKPGATGLAGSRPDGI